MNKKQIRKILEQHADYLSGRGGSHADLSHADLSGADLSGADLIGADLIGANLSNANLTDANLSHANLRGATLSYANLIGASLSGANLSHANLSGANLTDANLRSANLSGANLSNANLTDATLRSANLTDANLRSANLTDATLIGANLSHADLRGADLSGANLSHADLSGADLSGAKGIPSAAGWLRANTKTTEQGCILAYKAFGNTTYSAPEHWELEPGAYLTETVNPDRGTECGSGVNVGTLVYVDKNYGSVADSVWLVGIEPADIADVVVPFTGTGKFRAARVRLIRPLKKVNGVWVDE